MSFLSYTASAIKSRVGFPNRSSSESPSLMSVRSPPDLLAKSVVRETIAILLAPGRQLGASVTGIDDDATDGNESTQQLSQSFDFHEDPSFW